MKKLLLKSIIIALIFFVGISSAASIQWYDYDTGIKEAEKTGKPIMIFFMRDDPYSDQYGDMFSNDNEVIEQLNKFVCIKYNTDSNSLDMRAIQVSYPPVIIFINSNGQEILRVNGFTPKEKILTIIDEAWEKKDELGKPILPIPILQKIQINEYDLGMKTIKELNNFIQEKKYEKNIHINVRIEGFIRDIKGSKPYTFNIDDGSGTISATYDGGLGNINNGDKVIVDGYAIENRIGIIANKVNTEGSSASKNLPNSQSDSPKTNGFELILAFISIVATILFMNKK